MARDWRMPNLNRRPPRNGDTSVYISVGAGGSRISLSASGRGGACYVRAAVPRREAILRGATATAAAVALALVPGCGGGERQDAGEDDATYLVEVSGVDFPKRQQLAQRTQLAISVRNAGARTIPNLAVTLEADDHGTQVDAFGRLAEEEGLATRSRPVWVLDEGPGGGDTAYANTWALGPLRPDRTRTFRWSLSAVRPGRWSLSYRLAGSLTGRSRLRLERGGIPHGTLTVTIDRKPASVRVTPGGKIVSEPS
jgi:hypothetical protein